MKTIDKVFFKYLVYAAPFVIILMTWATAQDATELSLLTEGWKHYAWDFLGWVFMLWIVIGLYLILKMVISKSFRDIALTKINRMDEKDEREAMIIGEASKFSILSTMSLVLFLLFVSIFTVNIGRYPKEIKKEGKNGYISIGMTLNTSSQNAVEEHKLSDGQELFVYKGIPLSNTVLLFVIMIWLVMSYHYSLRKHQKLEFN